MSSREHQYTQYTPSKAADKDITETMDERWEFNGSVVTVFDEMLERSIPQYQVMRDLTTELAVDRIPKSGIVVDLGCSRGEAIAPIVALTGRTVSFVGLESSKPMIEAAQERFAGEPRVQIRDWDLRNGLPYLQGNVSVVLSVLTLMFTPINYRLRILDAVYKALKPGGCLLLVEKILGASATIDHYMVERYHKLKSDNGYSQEEIDRKRLALEGVQVPLTAAWNEDALRMVGFKEVDCYWRFLNFGAWVGIKT